MYGPSKYHWGMELFRSFFSVIDTVIYFVISGIYQVFFNIANSTLISGELIKAFFTRVQLILGIIILFKLAISLISGIINPDTMIDSKNGFSKIVTRIVTALIMLILIVPLNIPEEAITNGSYESQLNNNGILFGTMYEFQSRILSQNTLAKLILNKDVSMSESTTNETMADAGRELASTILKTFITVNLVSEEAESRIKNTSDYLEPSNRMCQDDDSTDIVDTYLLTNNVRTILNLTSNYCGSSGVAGIGSNGHFVFNYSFLISTIVGILFIIIMAGFTLDMTIRAFKLAILRLIAPVPIISYIDPKSDNGAFGAWSKTVASTYIDIFIRVAVVYFIIFVIDSFSRTGIVLEVGTGPIGIFSILFIFLGLFFFAKEAPKFITDSLGIKNPKGIFSGVGKILGLGAAMAGSVGSGIAAGRASYMADGANDKEHTKGRIAKNVGAGILGAGTGFFSGARAAADAKDHRVKAAFEAMSKRNSTTLAAGDAGSTAAGRAGSSLSRILFGETAAAAGNREIANLEAQKAALDAIKARMSSEMVKQDWTYGDIGGALSGINANYKKFKAAMDAAAAAGKEDFNIRDEVTGIRHTVTMEQANMQIGYLLKNNEDSYVQAIYEGMQGRQYNGAIREDAVLRESIIDAQSKNPGLIINNRDAVTKNIDAKTIAITDAKRRNARNVQNDRFSGSNK